MTMMTTILVMTMTRNTSHKEDSDRMHQDDAGRRMVDVLAGWPAARQFYDAFVDAK